MKQHALNRVIILALVITSLNGCVVLRERYGEQCKMRAYVQNPLADYISTRFQTRSPVRLAVIPFSTPANVAAYDNEHIGLGNQLSYSVQAQLLQSGQVPMVEVLNRQDWPGKKEEFFTGNYGAISIAREAGYDLVLVGLVEPLASLSQMRAYGKLIDVENGVTVWYGETSATTNRGEFNQLGARLGIEDRRPDKLYSGELSDKLAECFTHNLLADRVVPE